MGCVTPGGVSGDGRGEEGDERGGGEDVERGEERVDEADFFVGYEGES